MKKVYLCALKSKKSVAEEGLLDLIKETFDTDVSGLKVENVETFEDEKGENFVITCSKELNNIKTIKVFHVYG